MIWARFFLESPVKNGGRKAMCLSYYFVYSDCKALILNPHSIKQLLRQPLVASELIYHQLWCNYL
jgi:hypothetical protein